MASLSDLAQGDRRGPDGGQAAGSAGAGRSSARGCKWSRGDGEAAAKNNLDTAWLTETISNRTPIAKFFTEMTANAISNVEMTPNVNITGRKMKDNLLRAL